jgi:hypothetical protein
MLRRLAGRNVRMPVSATADVARPILAGPAIGTVDLAGAAIHSERGELLAPATRSQEAFAALQRAVVVPGIGVPLGLSATRQGEGR